MHSPGIPGLLHPCSSQALWYCHSSQDIVSRASYPPRSVSCLRPTRESAEFHERLCSSNMSSDNASRNTPPEAVGSGRDDVSETRELEAQKMIQEAAGEEDDDFETRAAQKAARSTHGGGGGDDGELRAAQRAAQRAKSTGSRNLAKWAPALASEELCRSIALLEARLLDVHPADWVAAYLLLCLSHIFPAAVLGGKRSSASSGPVGPSCPETLVAPPGALDRAHLARPRAAAGTLLCSGVEGLVLSARDVKKLGGLGVPVAEVLRRFELTCVPSYVNDSVVAWAAGLRPLILMTRVASVEELLLMQGEGRRCVTCFCSGTELAREWVDSYAPYAVKDSVHFTMHDLQHAEKFLHPELYYEQVGFLSAMRKVWAWCGSGKSKVPLSMELKRDVAHVVSDMNCCSLQMLDFLLARWQGAAGSIKEGLVSDRRTILSLLFGQETPWVHDIAADDAALCFGGEALRTGVGALMRKYFHDRGAEALALNENK